jgi:translation elongation factor EF-Tu-like GTPase
MKAMQGDTESEIGEKAIIKLMRSAGHVDSGPETGVGQAVLDFGGRRVHDHGPWDSGDGTCGTRARESGRRGEIVGLQDTKKSVVTGIEMFRK